MKKKIALVVLILTILLAVAGAVLYFVIWEPTVEEVKVEVGQEIQLNDFLVEPNDKAAFVTDISKIDTSALGKHEIKIKILGREFTSQLIVEDTVAPAGEAVPLVTEAGILPDVLECVTNIVDATAVAVSYKETPDVSKAGDIPVTILLTDEAGNITEIESTITVWVDDEPPVISGTSNKTVTVGGSISYKKGITVTDNKDENPTLEIDNSKVDLNKPGTYEVVYTATDKAGNSSSVTIKVTVKEKQVTPTTDNTTTTTPQEVNEATVNAMAQKVLDSITNSSMSKMDIAFAIYKWTNTHIGYTGKSDKSNWINGAYEAFTKRSGDCYTYFAAAKAMFRVAGIDNVDVVKSDTSHSRHYWSLINIGSGWYHVDATPRKGSGDLFFMVTDAELEAYSSTHRNSHIFDGSLYPARATESVQHLVRY